MTISGLVITTVAAEKSAEVIARLRSMPEVTLGENNGNKIALALETTDQESGKQWVSTMEEDPNVSHVDVVFVHFPEENQKEHTEI